MGVLRFFHVVFIVLSSTTTVLSWSFRGAFVKLSWFAFMVPCIVHGAFMWGHHGRVSTLPRVFHGAFMVAYSSMRFHGAFMELSWWSRFTCFHGAFVVLHRGFTVLSWTSMVLYGAFMALLWRCMRFHRAVMGLSWGRMCFHRAFMDLSWREVDVFSWGVHAAF